MSDHPVVWPNGEAVEVPGADERLLGARLCPVARDPHELDELGHLGGRGDVADEDPARRERCGDGGQALPGREHVEDHGVELPLAEGVGEVAEGEGPGLGQSAEPAVDVLRRHGRELLAPLIAVDVPGGADSA